jgi:adenylate kinase family enzyme
MDSPDFPYKRIAVIGATCSGKSTLARKLAKKLALDYIELDALQWGPNWTAVPCDVLCEKVERAALSPGWVSDGNYSITRHILWPRAEAIIWLDYPLSTILPRLVRRTWKRWWTQEKLWNVNRERLVDQFMLWSDRSLSVWLFKSHKRYKREYPTLFAQPEYRHLKVFQFEIPGQTDAWLNKNFGDLTRNINLDLNI